jgi:hypothetical protein
MMAAVVGRDVISGTAFYINPPYSWSDDIGSIFCPDVMKVSVVLIYYVFNLRFL